MFIRKVMTSTFVSDKRSGALPQLPRGGRRLWIALFAGLCFVLLVATAATHAHTTALSAHDCALCSAVADKVADTPAPPAAAQVLQVQPYAPFIEAQPLIAYVSPKRLPPSCGPPPALA